MSTKKIVAIFAAVAVIVIAVVALFMFRGQGTTPPPNGETEQNQPPAAADDPWRVFESPRGKYAIKLPSAWFIDPDAALGGGFIQFVSNNDGFELNDPGVVVEITAAVSKKSSESLLSAVKSKGVKSGDFGLVEVGFTKNGYEFVRVEHAYGNKTDGPGYAVQRTKTEYIYINASSVSEDEVLREMVHTIALLNEI